MESLLEMILRMRQLNGNVKLDIRTSCKMGMPLAIAVDQSLSSEEAGNIMKMVSEEDREKLREVAAMILKMAEAEDVYELLKRMIRK